MERADRLDVFVAVAIAVALVGLLALPMLQEANGPSVSGGNVIRDQRDLCYACTEDAPYPMLVWLELIVGLAGLVAGLGLSFRGRGWEAVARTVLLVVGAIVLLWAPFQTDTSDRPIGIIPLFELMGVALLIVAVLVLRRSLSRWALVTRALALAVSGVALLTVPGTRGQMPFTYDRLLWGYVIAIVATTVALAAAATAAARADPRGSGDSP